MYDRPTTVNRPAMQRTNYVNQFQTLRPEQHRLAGLVNVWMAAIYLDGGIDGRMVMVAYVVITRHYLCIFNGKFARYPYQYMGKCRSGFEAAHNDKGISYGGSWYYKDTSTCG